MRALLALAALAAIAAAITLGAQPPSEQATPLPAPPTVTPAPVPPAEPTPAPPPLETAEINRQDRTSRHHRDREADVFDARPLLSRLPLERDGVRIDIAGLAADDRTTVLAMDSGRASRARARALYESALRRAGDPGTAYVLEWAR
jgi:hypothetical protein